MINYFKFISLISILINTNFNLLCSSFPIPNRANDHFALDYNPNVRVQREISEFIESPQPMQTRSNPYKQSQRLHFGSPSLVPDYESQLQLEVKGNSLSKLVDFKAKDLQQDRLSFQNTYDKNENTINQQTNNLQPQTKNNKQNNENMRVEDSQNLSASKILKNKLKNVGNRDLKLILNQMVKTHNSKLNLQNLMLNSAQNKNAQSLANQNSGFQPRIDANGENEILPQNSVNQIFIDPKTYLQNQIRFKRQDKLIKTKPKSTTDPGV